MNTRLESMSHGDGKVYLQMVLDRLHDGSEVSLEARLKNGVMVPSHLFPFHPLEPTSSANYVVVLPHLDAREVDLFFVEQVSGEPLSKSRFTVELNLVRWRTRINTLVHNELTSQMLDIEREYCVDRMNIYFTDAVPDGDELVVKMLVDLPHEEEVELAVDFIDLSGEPLELPVYPLVDEVHPAERFGDEERLHVGFSVRVRAEAKDFCVIAYDETDRVQGGFAVFCNETDEPLQEAYEYCAMDAGKDPSYEEWYSRSCETLAGLAQQRRARLPYRPLVSLVMPVHPGDECYLPAALRAVHQQTYDNFELVVVDAGQTGFSYSAAAHEWDGDGRLVRIAAQDGLDDAEARLTGVLQSTGDTVAIVDPSVILAPEALFEYVRRVNEVREQGAPERRQTGKPDPEGVGECDVIYANHDLFGRDRGFYDPAFKPVYAPDLLYSYNYLGPVVFVSRRLVDEVSKGVGFASEAFDYDFVLKACEQAHRIERIDQVLYHVQDAVSISDDAERIRQRREEEAFRGGRKAVANALRRQGVDAVVLSEVADRYYRTSYRLPEEPPSLSIIIPTKDHVDLLETCVGSVRKRAGLGSYELVVVDNGSVESETHALYERLRAQGDVRIVTFAGAFNRAALCNAAAKTCSSDYLLFLDNDTELVTEDAVAGLLARAQRTDVGIVGAKLLFPDDTVQHAGMMVGPYGIAANLGVNMPRHALGYGRRYACASNVSCVSGACLMVRRRVFDEVEGFDERFLVSGHDVDFCLKVRRAGYYVVYDGGIELYHQEYATSGHVLSDAERLRAERERGFFHYRWPAYFVDGDPFMSACFDPEVPYYHVRPLD